MDNPAFSTEFDINKKKNQMQPLAFCTVFPPERFIDSSEELLAKLLSKELAGFAT